MEQRGRSCCVLAACASNCTLLCCPPAGGWCLEWAGDARKGHPAWLHPAVFVLTAAFDTLDHERAARQPLGLFARLRAAKAAAAAAGGEEGGSAAAQEQGWRGWWRSVLRFHGRA